MSEDLRRKLREMLLEIPRNRAQTLLLETGIERMTDDEIQRALRNMEVYTKNSSTASSAAQRVLEYVKKRELARSSATHAKQSLTKADLVKEIAKQADLTEVLAARALTEIIHSIVNALATDDEVRLSGFGTFLIRKRPARVGRNPQTGQPVKIKEAMVPAFKPGKRLKDAVN